MADLAELLAALKAEPREPSRELDARLWCAFTLNREFVCIAGRDTTWADVQPNAFNPRSTVGCGKLVFKRTDYRAGDDRRPGGPGGEYQAFTPPLLTSSLDAAVRLLTETLPNHDWIIGHTNGGLTIHAQVGPDEMVFGETPAMALCIAIVEAKIAEAAS